MEWRFVLPVPTRVSTAPPLLQHAQLALLQEPSYRTLVPATVDYPIPEYRLAHRAHILASHVHRIPIHALPAIRREPSYQATVSAMLDYTMQEGQFAVLAFIRV